MHNLQEPDPRGSSNMRVIERPAALYRNIILRADRCAVLIVTVDADWIIPLYTQVRVWGESAVTALLTYSTSEVQTHWNRRPIKHLKSHRFLHTLPEKTPAGVERTRLHSLVSHLSPHNNRLFSSPFVPCAVVSNDACRAETHESRPYKVQITRCKEITLLIQIALH